ncbi:hypothetical protein ABBQ38_000679 [Trebouxia sp. C0009 RCD-2024]
MNMQAFDKGKQDPGIFYPVTAWAETCQAYVKAMKGCTYGHMPISTSASSHHEQLTLPQLLILMEAAFKAAEALGSAMVRAREALWNAALPAVAMFAACTN